MGLHGEGTKRGKRVSRKRKKVGGDEETPPRQLSQRKYSPCVTALQAEISKLHRNGAKVDSPEQQDSRHHKQNKIQARVAKPMANHRVQ